MNSVSMDVIKAIVLRINYSNFFVLLRSQAQKVCQEIF